MDKDMISNLILFVITSLLVEISSQAQVKLFFVGNIKEIKMFHFPQLVGKQYNVGGEVIILGDKVSIKGFR